MTSSESTDLTKKDFINKLPEITAAFWFMKITATTLGETGGDWLSMTMKVGYGVSTAIFFGMFLLLLGLQLLAKRHHALLYWFVIIATSTAGTTMSDYMDRTLELGYTKGAAILVTILLCLLAAWKYTVGNVEVSHIHSRKAEIFYWMTILFSNTLGTAAGDFLADDSGLGFLGGWMLVTGILAVVILLYFTTKTPRILLFWIAFILTRPFGATFGDLLTKSHEKGGLDLGTAYSSMVLLGILIVAIMVAYRRSPEPVAQLS